MKSLNVAPAVATTAPPPILSPKSAKIAQQSVIIAQQSDDATWYDQWRKMVLMLAAVSTIAAVAATMT